MQPKAIHYEILATMGALHLAGAHKLTKQVIFSGIEGYSSMAIRKAFLAMLNDDWSEDGAWIEQNKQYYSISGVYRASHEDCSKGWKAYVNAMENPKLMQKDTAKWREEALTGITEGGKRSKINNAVISTATMKGGSCRDPEERAMQINRYQLGFKYNPFH